MTPDLVTTLRRVPLFNDLSQDELTLLAERASVRILDPRRIVFSEGDVCRELYIVQSGSVRTSKTSPNGRQQLIAIERAGSPLSEVSMFDGGQYPITAETLEAAELLRLESAVFLRTCEQHPQLPMKVIKVLAYRLRNLSRLVEDLSFSTVRGRLIAHLVGLAEEQQRTLPNAVAFELVENNDELAMRLGTVRELVSRNLGRLHGEGLIHMQRRLVTVPTLAR